MTPLTRDVLEYLIAFIKDNNDKCAFLMTCKGISECKIYFNGLISISVIQKSQWFDYFTHIYDVYRFNKLPKYVKHIRLWSRYNKPIYDKIPSSVTTLSLSGDFKQPTKNRIPYFVTKMIFTTYYYMTHIDDIEFSPFIKKIVLRGDFIDYIENFIDCVDEHSFHNDVHVVFRASNLSKKKYIKKVGDKCQIEKN